ncbi:MAG: hypothetical protein L3J01_02340 [Thiomicrorhabdus sp.]|nr:hypothetical protein [Thiomicrorhabdus sp.]
MNNLTKSIASLLILHPVIAFSATDRPLSTYVENYHPDIYTAAQQSGIDINALELQDKNFKNIDKSAFKNKSILIVVPPQESCEKSGGVFLENNFIATCVSKDGTFGNGSQVLGMTFNPTGSGTINSPDYLRPGSPFEYFSVTVNNQLFTNNNSNGAEISPPYGIQNTTVNPLNRSYTQNGGALVESIIVDDTQKGSKLKVIQKYTIDPNSKEIIVRVEMQNIGLSPLNKITYARGLDPDQDRPDTFQTFNKKGHTYYSPNGGVPVHVSPNNIAWASGKKGLSIALYSVDSIQHNTCISSTWTTDPMNILTQNCGITPQPIFDTFDKKYNFNYSDSTINIAFKLGSLKPNEKKVFSFKYLFNQEKPRKIDPIPFPKPFPEITATVY